MKYERFEDLPVWNAAADLAADVFRWSAKPVFRGKGDLANQIQRAALSVSNNIAEGFERGTTNELLTFLYYARGSAGEVRSMLCVMERMEEFGNLKSQISDLKSRCESISRQIRGWTNSLQNSEIRGQRHLNDRSKQQYVRKQRRQEFLDSQEAFRRELEERIRREAESRNMRGDQQEDGI